MVSAAVPKPETPEWRALVRLAVPLVVVNVGNQMMAAVDTALSGRIDALAQAATGLGNTLFFFGALLGIGVTMGIDPLTSQAFGAGRPEAARRALWQAVWLACAISVPVTAAIFGLSRALESIGIAPDLAVQTRVYTDARLASLLPLLLLTATRSYLQSAHRTRAIVAATLAANVFNLVADWALIFGDAGLVRLGLPAIGLSPMGVAGLGWATTAATVANLALFAWAARERPREPRADEGARPSRRPDFALIGRILALGLPIGAHMLAEIGIFTVAGLLAGRIGAVAMAAHQVALQLAALTFMVPMGVAAATSVRVGRAIGAGDAGRARSAGTAGIALGAAFMSLSAISMWTLSGFYARLMSSDPAVVPLAAELIVIAGVFQLFDGIQVVSAGALRGLGITRWTMGANLVAYWFIALPLLVTLGLGLELGPYGIWWGLTIGLAVAALLLSTKFASVSRAPVARLETA